MNESRNVRMNHLGTVTLCQSNPTSLDGDALGVSTEQKLAPAGYVERYAYIVGRGDGLGCDLITVWWGGSQHLFDVATGQCIESSFGLMARFEIHPDNRVKLASITAEEMKHGLQVLANGTRPVAAPALA